MSTEFEKAVLQKLDLMSNDISEIKTDVANLKTDVAELKTDVANLKTDVAELKTDVSNLKKDVSNLKRDVRTLKKGLKEVKEDTELLKREVFNVIKPSLRSIEEKVDLMTNINTARILQNQINNHKEVIKRITEYEKRNELEHSRMNYEICKLKANA